MTDDLSLALRYAPILHMDRAETCPLRAVGITVARETVRSLSFPKREIPVPEEAAFTIEYAYYFNYDIQHMYDLEHIWVTVGQEGQLLGAEGSFHGKYCTLLVPELNAEPTVDGHVHAFCQPGKHAFLPDGRLFRLMPQWFAWCNAEAGGDVLVGGPFTAEYSPTGHDLYTPTEQDNALSRRYLRECLAFTPTLSFVPFEPSADCYLSWTELAARIPHWIAAECERLRGIYGTA